MQFDTLPAEALAPIRARFLDALKERELRVSSAVHHGHAEQPAVLLDDVHKIRGVAPMLGMSALGALAADAEERLSHWFGLAPAANTNRMPDDLHHCLRALHAAIREALG